MEFWVAPYDTFGFYKPKFIKFVVWQIEIVKL